MRQQDREPPQYNLGHYEVLEELGQGGIGEVFVARPTRGEHAGTLVCLKVMSRVFQAAKDSRRQAAIDSLRREARAVSRLRHPNIARLLDSGAYNDVWFLAFELIAGANLGEILELQPAGVGLPAEHVRRIGIEVAAALQCAHEHDVLHRDIKPHNILVSTDGQVKVVDFGVAKVNARQTADFTVGVGTPRYWAPEQVREDVVSPRTDIFALGLVLYELLTTVHPFHADDPVEHRKNILRGVVPSRLRESGVPDDLAAIVECCLEQDPARRFQSAQALATALRSGAKASGFEYEMGEIAAVARDAVVEVRLLMKEEADAVEPGNDDKTALPRVHPTEHAAPLALAGTVKDGIPRALTQHVRDEVLDDLSRLAQNAYEQRQTQTGRRRNTTVMEGWQLPGISGVRPSEPPTRQEFQPPRDRQATAMEGLALSPEGLAEARQEIDTASREPQKTIQVSADMAPIPDAGEAASKGAPIARDNATRLVPRKRIASWPLAAAVIVVVGAYAVVALSPASREAEELVHEEQRPRENAETSVPAPQQVEQQPTTPAAATVEPDAVPSVAQVPAATAPEQPTAAPEPSADSEQQKDVSQKRREGRASTRPNTTSPARRATVRAEPRELVEVTIGIIPFGEVIVDGKPVGSAPVVVKLAEGRHRIVGRSLKLRRVKTVVVTPETNRIVLDLRNDKASQ